MTTDGRRIPTTFLAVLGIAAVLIFECPALAQDRFVWKTSPDRVDAQIVDWDLHKVLGEIAAATGWDIYVEPDTHLSVSVKFKDLDHAEALRRLIGNLNFALLPQANGPSRLLIFRTSLQEATQRIAIPERHPVAPTSKKAIPNELLVTLKPGAKKNIEELARRFGAKIVGAMDDLDTYRLQFDDEASAKSAREALAKDSDVADVGSNYTMNRPTQTDRLQIASTPPFLLKPKVSTDTGKVVIGLIDTSVQNLGQGMNDFLLPAIHVAGEPIATSNELSHGTSMAETLLRGLALSTQETGGSTVRILPVDVYGSSPDTTTFDVAKGIYAAINAGATVINLSMGGDGDSPLLAGLIHDTYKEGVLFFGAAGNQPSVAPTYPAAYPEVVAVTAGDKKGNIAPFANRGSFVDVIAPGSSLVQFDGLTYLVTGTSASTAYVSGAAAAYRATGKSASDVEQYLRETLSVKPNSNRPNRP